MDSGTSDASGMGAGRRKEHLQGPVSLTWYPMDGGPRVSPRHITFALLICKSKRMTLAQQD